MRQLLKRIIIWKLRMITKLLLHRYQPSIVAVTGSVGKTSTKDAIVTVLRATYNVRGTAKNYNNEIGIPLTLIGTDAPGRSVVKWFAVFFKALGLLILKNKNYPEIVVLEMGADHPGDIKYLTSFIPIHVGVVTAVAPAHLEFFETVERVAKEKSYAVRNVSSSGFAVLNADDPNVYAMKKNTKGNVLSYGFHEQADVRASELAVSREVDYDDVTTIQGLSFKVQYEGSIVPVLLPNILGAHMTTSALAAIAVGLSYDLNLVNIAESLKQFTSPPGRMKMIPGIKHTLLIDDTYNSSPLAAKAAVEQLAVVPVGSHARRFAVLGDMLELGNFTEQAHQELGELVANNGIDFLIAVGERARDIIRGAIDAGMSEDRCMHFMESSEAGMYLQERMQEGDIVLVKGSQGIRMEKIVKEIMSEPQNAHELLVRQDSEWQ